MGKKLPTINFKHKLKYKEKYDAYTIQMKHRHFPWWILLLLLPLLLLIKCNKDITVACYEPDTNVPIEDVPVTLQYEAHYLWDSGRILPVDSIVRTQKTDSIGKTTFKDLPCSVFSYIFYCLSKVEFTAKSGCHAAAGEKHNFHYTSYVELEMAPRLEDLYVKVVDLETNDPLPNAVILYKYKEKGEQKADTAHADAAGVVTLPKIRYCSVLDVIKASCYGYSDTIKTDVPAQKLMVVNDSSTMKLRPIKQRFTFFVKNKETKQPIPDASCTVMLTLPSGKKLSPISVKTSVDGKGIAMCDSAFILASLNINAKKIHFYDGDLEGGPWVVENFAKQPDDVRTIWLKPEPFLEEYINVDSITGKPLSGVRNKIRITDPSGNVSEQEEISNSNGVFPIKAKEGSKIEIVSTKEPDYRKHAEVGTFGKNKKIRMSPNVVTLNFRTVKDINGHPILPQCTLQNRGSQSGTLQPTNSGNGQFQVQAYITENLSITASKQAFKTNSSTVNNTPVRNLMNVSTDIPLRAKPVAYENSNGQKGVEKLCYDLGEPNSVFTFEWKLCIVCTMLIVADSNGNVIGRFGINSPAGNGSGQIYSPAQGKVRLKAKTQEICVTRGDVNGDPCWYKITKE